MRSWCQLFMDKRVKGYWSLVIGHQSLVISPDVIGMQHGVVEIVWHKSTSLRVKAAGRSVNVPG